MMQTTYRGNRVGRWMLPALGLICMLGSAAPGYAQTAPETQAGNASPAPDTPAPPAGLRPVAGLENLDLSNPASVRAQRNTWAHRVEVWAAFGQYALRDALDAVNAAREAAAHDHAGLQADLELLAALIHMELRETVEAGQRIEAARSLYKGPAKDKVGAAMAQGCLGLLEMARNHPDAALEHLQTAIDGVAGQAALEAWFGIALADVHLRRDQLESVVSGYENAIDRAREAGDAHLEGLGLRHLGIAHLCRNEPDLAAAKVEAAIMVHRTAKQPILEARAHRLRALCHLVRGDFNNARLEARRGVKLEPPMSGEFPPWNASEGFFWQVYQWKGEYHKSLQYVDRALRRATSGGDRKLVAHLRRYRGGTWLDLGHPRNAEADLRTAYDLYRDLGDTRGLVRVASGLVQAAYAQGQLARIGELVEQVEAEPGVKALLRERVDLYRRAARMLNKAEKVDDALAWVDRAVSLAEQIGDRVLVADLTEFAGELLEAEGRKDGALSRYEAAWKIFQEIDDPQWILYTGAKLEPLYKELGRKKDAKKIAKARDAYEGWLWTPLFRAPTMALADGVEMIRWIITVQRFSDMRSLGRASTYQPRYNVSSRPTSLNDYLAEFERIVAAFKSSGNVLGVVQPTDMLVRILIATGGWDEARRVREDQLVMVRDAGYYELENTYLNHAIDEFYGHDEVTRALELARQGVELARETGNRWHEADMLLALGDMQAEQGAGDEAVEAGKQALEVARALHDDYRMFYAQGVLAAGHRAKGDEGAAREAHDQAMALVERLDLADDDVEAQLNASNVFKLLGEYDRAIACLERAVDALPKEAKRQKEQLKEEMDKVRALKEGKKEG